MKQILILTKVQLGSAIEFIKIFGNGKKEKKHTSTVAILVLAALFFGFLSGVYSYSFGITFQMVGQIELLPGIMMAVTCMITLAATIYKVKGILFGTKDYDILMSLPVRTSHIVASRILLLYIINMFFATVIMLPNMIVYGYLAKPPIHYYILSFISLLVLVLVPMIIAAILGIILAAAASKFRHSNLINVVLMLVFTCAILAMSFQMQGEEQMAELGASLTKQIEQIYPLAGMYIKGVIKGNIPDFLIFIGISLIIFLLFCIITGVLFKKLNTSISGMKTRSNFKLKEQRVTSPLGALYKKELKRLFSSSVYLMNACISVVLMTLGSIVITIVQPKQLMEILQYEEITTMVKNFFPFILTVLCTMTYTSACSISMEGKNLWILKSSPILEKTIFISKIAVNLTIILPLLWLNTLILGIFFSISPIQWIAAYIIPTAYAFLISIGGLIINLKFPLLNWTNETVVIKQSTSSMITCFGGMILGIIPIILMYVFNPPIQLFIIIIAVIVILSDILLWNYLNKTGVKQFQKL